MKLKYMLRTYVLVAVGVFAGTVYSERERSDGGKPGPAVDGRARSRSLIATRAAARAVAWPLHLLTRSKDLEYRLLSAPLCLLSGLLRRFV